MQRELLYDHIMQSVCMDRSSVCLCLQYDQLLLFYRYIVNLNLNVPCWWEDFSKPGMKSIAFRICMCTINYLLYTSLFLLSGSDITCTIVQSNFGKRIIRIIPYIVIRSSVILQG